MTKIQTNFQLHLKDQTNKERDLMYSFIDQICNESETQTEEFNFSEKTDDQCINKLSNWRPFNIIRPDKGSGPPPRRPKRP